MFEVIEVYLSDTLFYLTWILTLRHNFNKIQKQKKVIPRLTAIGLYTDYKDRRTEYYSVAFENNFNLLSSSFIWMVKEVVRPFGWL